jgi:hypothetical protein
LDQYVGKLVKIQIDDPDPDYVRAKELAKTKAKEFCSDPMLLSWCQEKTGAYYPEFDCGRRDKPTWIVYSESRGGDITINVNDGEYIFIYLGL